MGLLSRLTGDARFEKAARRALKAIWDRRSSINLVGSNIHAHTGRSVSSPQTSTQLDQRGGGEGGGGGGGDEKVLRGRRSGLSGSEA
jgi:hypothetical protein